MRRISCRNCSRKFYQNDLTNHEVICGHAVTITSNLQRPFWNAERIGQVMTATSITEYGWIFACVGNLICMVHHSDCEIRNETGRISTELQTLLNRIAAEPEKRNNRQAYKFNLFKDGYDGE